MGVRAVGCFGVAGVLSWAVVVAVADVSGLVVVVRRG